jgi:hypothetical protein
MTFCTPRSRSNLLKASRSRLSISSSRRGDLQVVAQTLPSLPVLRGWREVGAANSVGKV